MKKRSTRTVIDYIIEYKKWLFAAVVILMVYSFAVGNAGFYTQIKLYFQGQTLKKEIKQAQNENKSLEQSVDSLKNDTSSLKGTMYEQGLAAEDEIIIIVDDEKK
jgi:cell division protein FtsB